MEDETIHRLNERINELEKRIDYLYDMWNIPHAKEFVENPQFLEALQKGDKMEAIKVYRMLTNCDLAAAKNAVDGIWNRYH